MTPWIQVYSNLPAHRKTCKLRDLLNLKTNYEAVGIVVCLWTWAAVNAPDGDLSGYSPKDIADAIGVKKPPAKVVEALKTSGFLDGLDGETTIHDWEEHAALLISSEEQQKANTRERVRRYRERRKKASEDGCNATCNASNAPTLPNLTLPNLTVNNYGGDDTRAGESEHDMAAMLAWLKELYPGLDAGTMNGIATATRHIVKAWMPDRAETYPDYKNVARFATRYDTEQKRTILSTDALQLLHYAFEKAVEAGAPGSWNYVAGVMERLAMREIYTLAEAKAFDETRGDE